MIFHFPPGKSYSLHYYAPKTGQQGRFSMEYVAWQILTKGDVDDDLFRLAKTPAAFIRALPKFGIKEDLPLPDRKSAASSSQPIRRTAGISQKKS